MNNYIVAFDVETTGLSQTDDFVIQLSAVKFRKDTFERVKTFNHYIKPIRAYEIKPGAFEAHGLTKEFIEANGVLLVSVADEFIEMFEDADALTYNGNRFDVNILYKDLLLIGKEFPMDNKVFFDSYAIEARLNPRRLSIIYEKYTGRSLEDAHNSMADVDATIEVFQKQLGEVAKLSSEEDRDVASWPENQLYSPEGSIRNAASGSAPELLVFNMGKYKDQEFMAVCKSDPGYIQWFRDKVASPYTWRLLTKYYKEHRNDVS
jgi:DNA polymerase III epsilon subunit-like protein